MNVYKQKRNFISLIRYRLWCSLFMIVAWTLNAIDAIPIEGIVAIPEATLVCTIFIVMLLWPLISHRKLLFYYIENISIKDTLHFISVYGS